MTNQSDINLHVVSAEKDIYSGLVSSVILSGHSGDFEVRSGHVPFLTLLRPGLLSFQIQGEDAEKKTIYVSGGIVEVQPNDVRVLADTALRIDELDEKRLEASQTMIQSKLATATGADYTSALSQLSQVLAQRRVLNTHKK